mgnify:CR=1 FL=1
MATTHTMRRTALTTMLSTRCARTGSEKDQWSLGIGKRVLSLCACWATNLRRTQQWKKCLRRLKRKIADGLSENKCESNQWPAAQCREHWWHLPSWSQTGYRNILIVNAIHTKKHLSIFVLFILNIGCNHGKRLPNGAYRPKTSPFWDTQRKFTPNPASDRHQFPLYLPP